MPRLSAKEKQRRQRKETKEIIRDVEDSYRQCKLYDELADEEQKRFLLINLLGQFQKLEEKVEKQAEVLVRIGSYNPERTQEAHC
jgi:thymidylate kinase